MALGLCMGQHRSTCLSIAINVSLANHLINLLISQLLAQVGHHVAQLHGHASKRGWVSQ